jgi:four helix bundle protein
MQPHRNLDVWKLSTELVLQVYKTIASFPKTELYALSDQLRRASVSIPSNIAE